MKMFNWSKLPQMRLVILLISLVFAGQLHAQNKTVTGSVRDDKGQPLAGATVTVKGGSTAASTTANGAFTISAADNSTLVFTSVGFTPKEVAIKGQSTVDIQLTTQGGELGEVIVVAYGNSTKKTFTGSLQTLKADELQDLPVTQFSQKLQGKLAGVQIQQTTGVPGAGIR